MSIARLNDNDLAELAANLVTLLEGGDLPGIDPYVRAALLAEFGTKPAEFKAKVTAALIADEKKKAAFSSKRLVRADLIAFGQRTSDALKAGTAGKDQFDLARLGFRSKRVNEYIAQTPTDMAATGFSNGVNRGRFKGNNRSTSVIYEIWRREGADRPWRVHIHTQKQTFDDKAVTPGRYYEYRVRAVAAKNTSGFSNSTIVYGVI